MTEPMLREVYDFCSGKPEYERVAAIEYQPVGPDNALVPVSVCTVDQGEQKNWLAGIYDFDWCKRDKCLYYHCSGGGGHFALHRCASTRKLCSAVWWDASLVTPTNGTLRSRTLSVATIRRYGYDVLAEPLAILGHGPNPFDGNGDVHESEVIWCERCKDHLPTENVGEPCEHIWWCEKCSCWSAPGERCKHRRPS